MNTLGTLRRDGATHAQYAGAHAWEGCGRWSRGRYFAAFAARGASGPERPHTADILATSPQAPHIATTDVITHAQ